MLNINEIGVRRTLIERLLLPLRAKLSQLIEFLSQNSDTDSKFVDLAPTDKADTEGVYANALKFATDNPRVANIALTGPYGSGKSSIIKSFLKNYSRPYMQISLAAFLPGATAAGGEVSRQEIERSILQQMLYGADANRLPLSRFKRIQSPGRWSPFASLFIVLGLFACWHLFQNREAIIGGTYFIPFAASNWFNLACFGLGGTFLWKAFHRFYVASFGVSLKSVSLKDIEITPEAATEESILNRHLDEIIYFFQSTKYDLVIVEDLDRFNNSDIFVTLREINSLINANSGVKRTIRFLYALRDNMFENTDRTKFFEFIIPVIPIINSSNSIDKVLEQGKRLSLDDRLDRQFLREVSRYLNDLRLIQNIFNEYAIYVANLEADGENILNANKLLAILIYKNVFPSDFEELHRGTGKLAGILKRKNEFIADGEAGYKTAISSLEEQIKIAESELPENLEELRRIYATAIIEQLPSDASAISLDGNSYISINTLWKSEQFDQYVNSDQMISNNMHNNRTRINIASLHEKLNSQKTFEQRKAEVEKKSAEFKEAASKTIRDLRAKISTLRVAKFNEIIRLDAKGVDDLFEAFDDSAELARFLIYEGFLDDTYYQYTSLFHSGRLSPDDNKFLIQIRAFVEPEPDLQIDNPREVIAAMRDDDFGQSYVLNVKIVDSLLADPAAFSVQTVKLFEFIGSNFPKCEAFFTIYYATGTQVPALISGLVQKVPGFVPSALASTMSVAHVAHIIAHVSDTNLAALPTKYPYISEFVSKYLAEILSLGIDFQHERLKSLGIEPSHLSDIESYPDIVDLLFAEGLYQLSVDNVNFIFRFILGIKDQDYLRKQHYTAVLKTENALIIDKIEKNFSSYLHDILLELEENTEESVSAILSVINRDELEIGSLKTFLDMQSALIPTLDEAPIRLHAMLFEIEKIEACWENCLSFLSSENYDAEILTAYLNKDDIVAKLSALPVLDTEQAKPLRKFLIDNDNLDDGAYALYVRALPRSFQTFPENLSPEKLQIVIEEKKVSFSSANLSSLNENSDLQILFVEKNIDRYLEIENECDLDDDFREKLLSSDIRDDHRLKIIHAMDTTLFVNMPSRAAIIGPILARAGSEISEFGAEPSRAIILNSRPIEIQISLLNKLQQQLDNQQIREILNSLPEPFSDIKPGWGTPRIESTNINLEFVTWLKARSFISSWKRGGLWDDDIRINLFRK